MPLSNLPAPLFLDLKPDTTPTKMQELVHYMLLKTPHLKCAQRITGHASKHPVLHLILSTVEALGAKGKLQAI